MEAKYIIICPEHGEQKLSYQDYKKQLSNPDISWKCPICKQEAEFKD
jgi:hypothetical protein